MTTEVHVEAVPHLCSLGHRPHLLTGFFRQWFQTHFSLEAYVEAPELRSRLWTAMPSTGILVEASTNWQPNDAEKRPAVIVHRDDYSDQRVGIDDRLMGGFDLTGSDFHSNLVTGSHTLFAVARTGTEVEILAGEVYREMKQFGPVIRRLMDLKRFATLHVGRPGKLEEARETYAVPVVVGYVYEDKWVLIPHAPKLKRFVLSALLP